MNVEKQRVNSPIEAPRSSVGTAILLIGIILIGANLRAPMTAIGPLIKMIQEEFHLSNTLAGMITTIPLFCFAGISPFIPKLAHRFGVEKIILYSLIILTIGIIVRSVFGETGLFTGTILIGFAIAFSNVLLPSLIKRDFPNQIGLITGVYSISMSIFGALASGISYPLATKFGFGWSKTLLLLAVMSVVGLMFWLPQVIQKKEWQPKGNAKNHQSTSLLRSKVAWQVTFFMGIQSLIFYSLIAWLPKILAERGVATSQSGWLLSVLQLALLPFTFLVAIFAGKMKDQRILAAIGSFFMIGGVGGLLAGGTHFLTIWIMMIGIGGGFSYSLSMIFFSSRTHTIAEAAQLSGMAQSFGYLLAACGPILLGLIHDVTNSWQIPLYGLLGMSLLLLYCGLGAARNIKVS